MRQLGTSGVGPHCVVHGRSYTMFCGREPCCVRCRVGCVRSRIGTPSSSKFRRHRRGCDDCMVQRRHQTATSACSAPLHIYPDGSFVALFANLLTAAFSWRQPVQSCTTSITQNPDGVSYRFVRKKSCKTRSLWWQLPCIAFCFTCRLGCKNWAGFS
jgi:hypothetical protein